MQGSCGECRFERLALDALHAVMPARHRIAAYLLAGGASRRMGRCKARLEVDGTPLALRLAQSLQPWVERVYLVAKRSQAFEDLGLPLLLDDCEERALVQGLRTVLEAPGPEWRFVCATDMPEVGPPLLGRLWETARESGCPGSYPLRHDRDDPEPLPTLWQVPVRNGATEPLGMAARSWVRAAGLAACRLSAAEAHMLVHVNEPEEWHVYLQGRRSSS